jgi:hypothetical protein
MKLHITKDTLAFAQGQVLNNLDLEVTRPAENAVD